jgi:hypothetical protein
MVAARQHLNRLEALAGDHHPNDHELATNLARIRDAVDAITCCCPSERLRAGAHRVRSGS